jgi:hypothetical protein
MCSPSFADAFSVKDYLILLPQHKTILDALPIRRSLIVETLATRTFRSRPAPTMSIAEMSATLRVPKGKLTRMLGAMKAGGSSSGIRTKVMIISFHTSAEYSWASRAADQAMTTLGWVRREGEREPTPPSLTGKLMATNAAGDVRYWGLDRKTYARCEPFAA